MSKTRNQPAGDTFLSVLEAQEVKLGVTPNISNKKKASAFTPVRHGNSTTPANRKLTKDR